MTATTPAEVLRATAEWFEENPSRWGVEMLHNRTTGCRCALGGIAAVLDPTDEDADPFRIAVGSSIGQGAVMVLCDYLVGEGIASDDLNTPFHIAGSWNDAPGRTVHEVIGTLRAAARWAEER